MKKLLVVLGLSVIAMAGKCGSSSEEKSKEASKEEFPVKEESQVPAEEVPSYEQQEEAQPAPAADGAATTPAPAEGAAAPAEGNKAP